jgi:hypothetical protein
VLSAIALGSCFSMAGCAGYKEFIEDETDTTRTEGRFEASGVGAVPWSFAAEECESGDHEGFFGVTFVSQDKQHAVRVVRNPIGPMTVAIASPQDPEVYVPLDCKAVVGSIRRTGIRVNHVPVVTGEVRFLCEGLRGAAIFTCS